MFVYTVFEPGMDENLLHQVTVTEEIKECMFIDQENTGELGNNFWK